MTPPPPCSAYERRVRKERLKIQERGCVGSEPACCFLFSVSGPVRHAQIMRRCGLEQVCCSYSVPTSDSGQSRPRLWVTNLHSLSPTRQSKMHANDKGRMNRYIGNVNRERNERRTYTGAPITHKGTLSYLAYDARDLVLLYQNTPRYHYPAA